MAIMKIDDNLIRVLLLALLIFIVYNFILLPLDFLLPLKFAVNDSVFSGLARFKETPEPGKEAVIVTIDEETLMKKAKRWPWNRGFFAEIIERISRYNPKVIGVDIAFIGESDNEEEDKRLAQALDNAGNVVLASYISEKGDYLVPHSPFLETAYGCGFVNKVSSKDFKVRKARIAYRSPKVYKRYFSFEIMLLAAYFGVPADKIGYKEDSIIIDQDDSPLISEDLVVPVGRIGTMYINYSPVKYLPVVSLTDVLEDTTDELKDFFEDKIVLLGQTSKTLHDIYQTPVGFLPGVFINAFALDTIMKQSFFFDIPNIIQLAVLLVLMLLTAFFAYCSTPPKGLLFLGIEFIVILAAFQGAAFYNWKVDYFSFLFLVVLSYFTASVYKYGCMLYSSNKLKRMVITDTVTGLATPRYFQFKLQLDISKVTDNKAGVSVVIFTIPEFQELLKAHSHQQLGIMLRQFSIVLKQNSRKRVDLLTRWKEDRFAAILIKTDINDAATYSQKIISKIEETEFLVSEGIIRLTVFAGISNYPTVKTQSALDIIACAEAASNRAKLSRQQKTFPKQSLGLHKACVFNSQEDKIQLQVLGKKSLTSEDEYLTMDIAEREKELLDTLSELKKSQQETEKAHFDTILSLVNALEEKDPYTAGHSERVAEYAVGIAREMGLEEGEIELIRQSALLHDIGKFGLPDRILHKKEKLTEEEVNQIKKHPVMGARILERSRFFEKHLPLLLHHHERFDGKGYPHGLSGKFIPKGAQIIAIADAVDAMTTGRGYNHVLSVEESIGELKKSSGTHFDPEYVNPAINFLMRQESEK